MSSILLNRSYAHVSYAATSLFGCASTGLLYSVPQPNNRVKKIHPFINVLNDSFVGRSSNHSTPDPHMLRQKGFSLRHCRLFLMYRVPSIYDICDKYQSINLFAGNEKRYTIMLADQQGCKSTVDIVQTKTPVI